MWKGKLPTNIKTIICRNNGIRVSGGSITSHLLLYALNNREHFNFIYQGDIFEPAKEAAPQEDVADPTPRFSESDLKRMNKGPLQELCAKLGVVLEGDPTKDELVEMILSEQFARA